MKMVDCVKYLTAKERAAFREQLLLSSIKFLPDIVALYDRISSCIERNQCESLQKHQIWEFIHPEKKFNDSDWRWLCSRLTTQIEQFLVKTIANEAQVYQELKIKAFYDRNATKYALQEELEYERILEAMPKGSEYYSSLYFHKTQHINYAIERDNRQYKPDLAVLNRLLDIFYLLEKMRHYCDALNREMIVQQIYDLSNIQIIEHIITATPEYLEEPTVRVYYGVIQLLRNKHSESVVDIFSDIKDDLFKHYHLFTKKDRREFLIHLQNYCIRNINQGNTRYRVELFELYERGIEQRDLFEEGVLSASAYKNILTLGILLVKYDWSAKFLEDYSRFLLPAIRENIHQYSLARLYFAQYKYDDVIEILSKTGFNEVFYILDARCLLIKTYYEKKQWYAIESMLPAFRAFIEREKAIKDKKPYIKFVKYIFYLLKAKKNKKEILEKLQTDKSVVEYKWLLEQFSK